MCDSSYESISAKACGLLGFVNVDDGFLNAIALDIYIRVGLNQAFLAEHRRLAVYSKKLGRKIEEKKLLKF